SAFTGKSDGEITGEFEGKGYGDFKMAVGETVADALAPVRERFAELMKDRAYLDACCAEGLEQAMRISRRTRDKVYKKMGFTL
ncbi:MAG: tryptophan--tRNA ligase, partial [Oscillospiraceae bacterium]